MIEAMKGTHKQKMGHYEESRDKMAKRVIAAICQYVDKLDYTFKSRQAKIRYVIGIACRAANCGNFNAIPVSRLSAIYNLYCKRQGGFRDDTGHNHRTFTPCDLCDGTGKVRAMVTVEWEADYES